MAEFHNAHRQDTIEIKLVEQRLQNVMESVEGSQAEIGFVMVNNVQLKEFRHTTNYKNLEFHLLGKDTWYLNVGPHSPFYDRKEVYMEDLLDSTFIRLPDDYFSNLAHYLKIGGIPLGRSIEGSMSATAPPSWPCCARLTSSVLGPPSAPPTSPSTASAPSPCATPALRSASAGSSAAELLTPRRRSSWAC
ncbi:MAG: LysR family transcriptional regulator substrate-binding protein [Flavonifractor plautii]